MEIDLGYLGRLTLQAIEPQVQEDGFTVVFDGYTESGIRVHGVVDAGTWASYPCVWNNAIIIEVSR